MRKRLIKNSCCIFDSIHCIFCSREDNLTRNICLVECTDGYMKYNDKIICGAGFCDKCKTE